VFKIPERIPPLAWGRVSFTVSNNHYPSRAQ